MPGSSVVSKPEVTIALSGARQSISNDPQIALINGLMDSASGSATPGALTENVPSDTASIVALFGPQSTATMMAVNFRKQNPVTQLDVIALTPTGAAAAGAVSFSGTATEAGTYQVIVGSEEDFTFTLNVADTDTATVIGDALVTLITASAALTTQLAVPVSEANVTGTVTFTADELGLQGNFISLKIIGSVAGVTTATTAFTSGTGDPSSAATYDVIADQRYQTFITPSAWDTSVPRDLLDARFNEDNAILDGVLINTYDDTLANILSLNNALNSQSQNTLNFNVVADTNYKGNSMLEFNDGISAQFGGIRALRLTKGALIADLLVGQTGLDITGGPALASRPYFNTPVTTLPLIPLDKGWNKTEMDQINTSGGSTIGTNETRTGTLLDAMYTTYKTDAAANPDTTFNFLNKVDTSVNVREFFFNNIKADFAQMRLTAGELVENRPIANESLIRARLMGYYRELSEQEFALTVKGAAAEKVFSENMNIIINFDSGLVTVIFSRVPLVSQFREFIGDFKVVFGL